MAKEMTKKLREELEMDIYKILDILDKSKINSEYYKKLFASMDNKEFTKFISLPFPYRFHYKPFTVEPTMEDAYKACKYMNVPLMEEVNLPYLYENNEGQPVKTQECLVIYCPLKKMQQFITKKNSMSTDISKRDMKTGLLIGYDKNGKSSDREIESLAVLGLFDTMEEMSKHRADAMDAKNKMYNLINITGQVSIKDVPVEQGDSLSKNLMNTYLLGAHIQTNIINQDYYLPYTLKHKNSDNQRSKKTF